MRGERPKGTLRPMTTLLMQAAFTHGHRALEGMTRRVPKAPPEPGADLYCGAATGWVLPEDTPEAAMRDPLMA